MSRKPRPPSEGVFAGGGVGYLEISAISTNFRHNEQIRISPIFLIDENDNKVGIVSTSDALRKAQEAGLDLVEVAPNARPPVCKIMDFGKWRYQQQKKEDKSRASSRAGQLKELKLRTVKIGDHDLQIKINHAREFLAEGNKVQFTLQFRGREVAHMELGREIMKKVKSELADVSKVEPGRDSKLEGRRMTLVLQPEPTEPAKPERGEKGEKHDKGVVHGGGPSGQVGLGITPRPAAPAPRPAPTPTPAGSPAT